MLKGLIGSVIAVGLSSSPIINKPIDNSLVSPKTQVVIYDDDSYKITLSADEVNTYSFENFILALSHNGNYSSLSFDYSSSHFEYDDNTTEEITYIDVQNYTITLYLTDTNNNQAYHIEYSEGVFNNVITLLFDSSNYNEYKDTIELDIQANQPAENNMPSVTDLFGYITQGVNAFIGSLGQAFESVVALFWDSTATTPGPTFLGLLMLISIGAGLIFLAYRVIKRLVYRVRG